MTKNRKGLDTLWQQALTESIKDGEPFTRYHFAKLVAASEREALTADTIELFGNSGLRDQFACAALGGCLSAKGWHPEYIIPAGGGHVGGQRAADAAAESAYKYADAMLKAREKK